MRPGISCWSNKSVIKRCPCYCPSNRFLPLRSQFPSFRRQREKCLMCTKSKKSKNLTIERDRPATLNDIFDFCPVWEEVKVGGKDEERERGKGSTDFCRFSGHVFCNPDFLKRKDLLSRQLATHVLLALTWQQFYLRKLQEWAFCFGFVINHRSKSYDGRNSIAASWKTFPFLVWCLTIHRLISHLSITPLETGPCFWKILFLGIINLQCYSGAQCLTKTSTKQSVKSSRFLNTLAIC